MSEAGVAVGGAKAQIIANAGVLLLATFLLHASGFALGYALARMLGLGVIEARTISIEVGMQSSALAAVLARLRAPGAQSSSTSPLRPPPPPRAQHKNRVP